jgi:hypothetical protein
MSYYMFLDDLRNPQDVTWVNLPKVDWVVVRNYAQFRDYIETNGFPKFISFDHDLADEHYAGTGYMGSSYSEKTGYDCAKWLVEVCLDSWIELPDFVVHSMNLLARRTSKPISTTSRRVRSNEMVVSNR